MKPPDGIATRPSSISSVLVVAVALVALACGACGGGKAKGGKGAAMKAPTTADTAAPLPAFGGTKIATGKAWKSSALRGRVLVIDTFDDSAAAKAALARYVALLNAHASDPLNAVLLVRDQAYAAAVGADAPQTLAVVLDDGGAAAVALGLKAPGNPIVSDRGGVKLSQGPADDGLAGRVKAALDKPATLDQPVMPKGFNQ